MKKDNVILAALAATSERLTPVQVQKLFFLLDRRVPQLTDGPLFNFEPYDYGPFDKEVYTQLNRLSAQGFVEVGNTSGRFRTYGLTPEGRIHGEKYLSELAPELSGYIKKLANWVCRQSFASLVSAIYSEFPEMRVRSIFREVTE